MHAPWRMRSFNFRKALSLSLLRTQTTQYDQTFRDSPARTVISHWSWQPELRATTRPPARPGHPNQTRHNSFTKRNTNHVLSLDHRLVIHHDRQTPAKPPRALRAAPSSPLPPGSGPSARGPQNPQNLWRRSVPPTAQRRLRRLHPYRDLVLKEDQCQAWQAGEPQAPCDRRLQERLYVAPVCIQRDDAKC